MQILREPSVRQLTGLSRSTRWRLQRIGAFPKPIRLSPGAIGYDLAEVEQWLEERRQARDSAAAHAGNKAA